MRQSAAVTEGGETHSAAVAESRAALLEEIGDGHDLIFARGAGNIGDHLIWAGTRNLLEDHVYREISVEELPRTSGDTVLLTGGGAWCRPFCAWMPRALAIAELRFDRVIVLPSSFDVREDVVRDALMRSRATVFARDPASFAAISGLCRAHLAYDCAFFFDFSSYRTEGHGTLNAFRTDTEAPEGEVLLPDNDDISWTRESLPEWLEEIARHALVRTDRAHVMLAAALMGKQVEFAPSSYHKVTAIADWSLSEFAVRAIPAPRQVLAAGSTNGSLRAPIYERLRKAAAPIPAVSGDGPARITAAILSRNRPQLVAAAVRSVTAAAVPVAVLVIDNNSDRPTRRALAALADEDPRVGLRLSDRNLGCAGGRRLAAELAETEFVLFLDDDAELIPGALEHLLADLDAHPDAAGVTGQLVTPDGTLHHYGGSMAVSEELVTFTLGGAGLPFDDPSLPPTGPSGWAPGTAALLRMDSLREFSIDSEMVFQYEDNDWCYRVERARPGSFRRCREALVLHHLSRHDEPPSPFVAYSQLAENLMLEARFLRAHGRLLDVDLTWLLPDLRLPDGSLDVPAARLLLELVAARGTDWTTMVLANGELEPLFARARLERELEQANSQAAARQAMVAILEQREETLSRIEAGGWWRLRSRLLPLIRIASAARDMVSSRP